MGVPGLVVVDYYVRSGSLSPCILASQEDHGSRMSLLVDICGVYEGI